MKLTELFLAELDREAQSEAMKRMKDMK